MPKLNYLLIFLSLLKIALETNTLSKGIIKFNLNKKVAIIIALIAYKIPHAYSAGQKCLLILIQIIAYLARIIVMTVKILMYACNVKIILNYKLMC